MKRKYKKPRRKNRYISIHELKYKIKKYFRKYTRKCFFLLSIALMLFFLSFYFVPNIFLKYEESVESEAVFIEDESTKLKLLLEEKDYSKNNSKNNNKNNDSSEELLTINTPNNDDLISTKNVEYKSDEYYEIENHFDLKTDQSKLTDLNYLKNNLYIVDSLTDMTSDVFDIQKLLSTNLKLDNKKDVKVLIFNTHSSEIYKDSKNSKEGVVGLSYELQKVLNDKYGIKSIVHNGVYDSVNGKSQILGAYQRMSPEIEKILAENPTIEVCIDIHRDGLPENIHLVSEINGKPTAQIMFVNGLSKVFDSDGTLINAPDLPNPNLQDNLAFSLALKLTANEMYPSFARKIYLHAYRYSLFMKPKSILVEVGSQTNTWTEAKNAVEPLADILAQTLLPTSK